MAEHDPLRALEVWIADQGCYSEYGIVGVYATAEDAMADNPAPDRPIIKSRSRLEREGGWRQDEHGNWHNGLGWGEAMSVTKWVVNGRINP